MNRILLTLFLQLFALFTFSQNNVTDCSSIRTGEFAYKDSVSNSIWNIKRNKKTQIEKNEKTGVVVKFKLKWISACEYKLTQIWTNDKTFRIRNFRSNVYSIISIKGDIYTYSCNCGDGTTVRGDVVKLTF